MKIRYLNGEKVYVDDRRSMGSWSGVYSEYGKIGVCKHRDVIRELNSLLNRAEKTPEERTHRDLWSLLYAMDRFGRKGGQKPLWEIMDEEAVFDDPGKVRLAKEPRPSAGKRVNVLQVGEPRIIEHGDSHADEFRAFQAPYRDALDGIFKDLAETFRNTGGKSERAAL
ncbi:MAG: hypothetical protein NTV58_06645 [Deltaproteobacteria bacterium]|nr:hypothetical protein [Deltaproteobacteria bacterium]